MTNEWNLYYEGWIIGDGEPDRRVGEVFDWWALEFGSVQGLASAKENTRSATPVGDFEYLVVAEVVYVSPETDRRAGCLIDFGLKAVGYSCNLPPGSKQGDYVCGIIGIGMPAIAPTLPEALFKGLEHRWRVNRIFADLTPYSSDTCMRDRSRIQYQEVDSTEALRTQLYFLNCSEVP
jgi:hypothetical protein